MFLKDVEEVLYGMLRKNLMINHPRLSYAMWVKRVQGRKLENALFKRRDAKGHWDIVAWAREADLHVDSSHHQLVVHMHNGVVYDEKDTHAYFLDRLWPVPLPEIFGTDRPKRPRDQSWQEMRQNRQSLVERAEEAQAKTALGVALKAQTDPPQDLPRHLSNLQEMRESIHLEILSIDTEMQMRPALAFGCICFALVGCPVGIWFSRSDYLSSFITCFLPIVFVYYPLLLCGTNMAKEGKFTPFVTVWAANGVMMVITILLTRRLMRN